jgi:hypothetical protein
MRIVLIAVFVASCLAGCASVRLNAQREAATTLAPFDAQLGLNRVSVPSGSELLAASIDGHAAFCTKEAAWFALGEARGVCFTDTARSGYLDRYYVEGTLRSLTYSAHIPYLIEPAGAPGSRPSATVTAADMAECVYQAQLATVGERGILMPAVDAANLQALCFKAAAARNAERQITQTPPHS